MIKINFLIIGSCAEGGEFSYTGLHGANRLASNSLLEASVYAERIFKYISRNPPLRTTISIVEWNDEGTVMLSGSRILQKKTTELQNLMRRFAGVVRNNTNLKQASLQLERLYTETESLYEKHKLNTALCQLRNMINVAHLIIQQSLIRKESKGGYYNKDYNKDYIKETI